MFSRSRAIEVLYVVEVSTRQHNRRMSNLELDEVTGEFD